MNERLRASCLRSLGCLAAAVLAAELRASDGALETGRESGRSGGRLVVALRAEPRTWNPLLAVDHPSLTVIGRLMADLIHVDRASQQTVPALAERWTRSDDGRTFRLELRRGVVFSDGHPFDADDVLFSFRAYLDEATASPYRDQLMIEGEPITVRKLGSHTVAFELARPDAWGERLFDSLVILPQHRLAEAAAEGRLAEAWGLAAPPEEIVGLGPFRLRRYVPGQRLELERNPRYWKFDRQGRRLPYLDELTLLFVASEDAQVLRFQSGETNLLDRLSAASFALLERRPDGRGALLHDLGPGLAYEFLVFNQNDLAGRQLSAIERKQRWFRDLSFRRAVSRAIDRDAIVRLVYHGRATPIASHVSPGNRLWAHADLPPPQTSHRASRELLRRAGFTWDAGGRLRDPDGAPVELTIATSASNGDRVRIATLVQDDLERLGLEVRVAPIEFGTLIDRLKNTLEYEVCLVGLGAGDVDPSSGLAVWLVGGTNHFWNLGRERPATPWEAEIDRLMRRQMTILDPAERGRLVDRVQELAAENLPFIFLISPNVLVASRRELGNFSPAVLEHHTLWNAEELFWHRDPRGP